MPDTAKIVELFDQRALNRIVAITGRPLRTGQEALQSDLVECYRAWVLLSYFGPRPARKHIIRLAKIMRWAADGEKLLRDDALIARLYPSLYPQIKLFVLLLENVSLEHVTHSGSPLQNLTGVLLPAVFKYHFKLPAKISRDPQTHEPGGPYIRFALEICTEFAIKCSAEAIVSAIKRHGAKSVQR
jgi:hypothetical protein